MGIDGAAEIASVMYANLFNTHRPRICRDRISWFLDADPFGSGCVPARFVKKLELCSEHGEDVERVLEAVELLLAVQLPPSISIKILLMRWKWGDGMSVVGRLAGDLEALRPMVERCEEQGHLVTLEEGCLKQGITGFYTMPKDAWNEMLKRAIEVRKLAMFSSNFHVV